MKNLETKPRWKNAPAICSALNLPAFETQAKGEAFFASFGDGAVSASGWWHCDSCDGWHAKTRLREVSGSSSGTGTRHLTLTIPERAKSTLARLTARQTREWKAQR
jgi:hypothetical protein